MASKINIDSVSELNNKTKITESVPEIIQLKRKQNSLLPIARIPPEILGPIFKLSVTKRPYAFLLVCHYWHEVACCTPELWNDWGNSLRDWKRSYRQSKASTPVILRLREDSGDFFNGLSDVLKDRTATNSIQEIDFTNNNSIYEGILPSILASLTPKDNTIRHSSIKSFSLNSWIHPINLSNFFSHQKFTQLQSLSIHGPDLPLVALKYNTSALVNLSIANKLSSNPSSTSGPTTSQIISLLDSNPNLRTLNLALNQLNDDSNPNIQNLVPLRYLEEFCLSGMAHPIGSILSQLRFFGTINKTVLTLFNCTPETIQVIGPYISNDLQNDVRLGDGLEVHFTSDTWSTLTEIHLPRTGTCGLQEPKIEVTVNLAGHVTPEQKRQIDIDILPGLSKEQITHLKTNFLEIEGMPSLKSLSLDRVDVSKFFMLPKPYTYEKLLPSLQQLHLYGLTGNGDEWDHLINYLTQIDSQSLSLTIDGTIYIPSEVLERIKKIPFKHLNRCNKSNKSNDQIRQLPFY